jgi:hypothetical protein
LTRHCEERSDEAIQIFAVTPLDCFASLAMTEEDAVGFNPMAVGIKSDMCVIAAASCV